MLLGAQEKNRSNAFLCTYRARRFYEIVSLFVDLRAEKNHITYAEHYLHLHQKKIFHWKFFTIEREWKKNASLWSSKQIECYWSFSSSRHLIVTHKPEPNIHTLNLAVSLHVIKIFLVPVYYSYLVYYYYWLLIEQRMNKKKRNKFEKKTI